MATKSSNSKKDTKSNKKNSVFNSPILNYRYRIELDGIEVIGFSEMNELSNETEVIEYKEGGLNGYVHKFPAHTTFTNIELKHGLSLDESLREWRDLVINGDMTQAKKSGTIKAYYGKDNIAKVWSFDGAWPSKLKVDAFNATENGLLIETIELVIERFERKAK